uniref:Uncharacterized protein n=1 Tax=Timema genevievae TaxID=629358 RepID=A0A7R9K227_TIMGE|nr:unnamed protein product [Timema genevievae]
MCNQSELADKGESPSESSHLEGMLNDLVNKGFLPSITEEQTRSLQDMYSQLHEDTAEAKEAPKRFGENLQCYGELENDLLRDDFELGVSDGKLRKKLLSDKCLTLETAVNLAKAHEATKKQIKILASSIDVVGLEEENKNRRKQAQGHRILNRSMTADQGGTSDLQHWTFHWRNRTKYKSKRYHQGSKINRKDQGPEYQLKQRDTSVQDKKYRCQED